MFFEFLLYLLLIILYPILEYVISALIDKIYRERKWHPFEQEYNQATQDGNATAFSMLPAPATKESILAGIIGFALIWLLGVLFAFIGKITGEITFWEAVALGCIFSVLCSPFIILFLHNFTRKIYVCNTTIFLKSYFVKKQVNFADIVQITKKKYPDNPSVTHIIIKTSKNTIRIPNHYSNYDRFEQLFHDKLQVE